LNLEILFNTFNLKKITMKKLLLFVILMSFLVVNAQQHDRKDFGVKSTRNVTLSSSDKGLMPEKEIMPGIQATPTFIPSSGQRDVNFVNPIAIGQAGNAFGFAFMRTTYLWADNNINSISFMHRMNTAPGTGYLAYDISKNGGIDGSWTNNVQVYNPTLPGGFQARYPQGALYNPVGNTDPDNAYFHYFAPTLDGSNTSGTLTWGGYAYGVRNLAEGSTPTQHDRTSSGDFHQFLPSGFTITQTGDAWMVDDDEIDDGAGAYTYNGNLIVGHGIWDTDLNDYVYDFQLWPLEINPDDGINDLKVAFAPDGMTGYVCVMSNLPDAIPYTSYHPILFKTTDGGETWSDPIEVQLGGVEGLQAVQEFIADSMLAIYYDPDPVPPRNEIAYWMGYEIDLSVDAWGNPHIAGDVAIADLAAGTIATGEGFIAMFHVWSDDQGVTWKSFDLGNIHQFTATFGVSPNSITMYNRPQVATTQDGVIVFFSWIDSDTPGLTDNSQPNIFFREYLPTMDQHGEQTENVTYFSAGMWSAFYGCMSHYVFTEVTKTDFTYTCTIPFVYEQMGAANDPLLPVQFWYIPDFVKTYVITGIDDKKPDLASKVSQNYPNPFNQSSVINVEVPEKANLKLVVTNLVGQQVMQIDRGVVPAGTCQFNIDGSKLGNGVYFYTVISGKESVTKKMVVK
jgi:hypothetical protein